MITYQYNDCFELTHSRFTSDHSPLNAVIDIGSIRGYLNIRTVDMLRFIKELVDYIES